MSDMKTIMENFRQFERNDMENKIEKLLKENKNHKKRLNKTRKIKEGVMAGVGMGLKIGAVKSVKEDRLDIGRQLRKIWESIPCDIEDELATVPIELEIGDLVIGWGSDDDIVGDATYAPPSAEILKTEKEILSLLGSVIQGGAPLRGWHIVPKAWAETDYKYHLIGAIEGVPACQLKAAFDRAASAFESPTPTAGYPASP